MVSSYRPRRSTSLSVLAPADLRACANCGGLVEAAMMTCPTCGQWLGRGSLTLWLSCIMAGSLLVILAFFLPWLDGQGSSQAAIFSGFELAQMAWQLAISASGSRPTTIASLSLFLAPLAAVGMLSLIALHQRSNLPWMLMGRLVVGLAAVPGQIALLAILFGSGLMGNSQITGWPHVGLIATAVGSLLAIAGGIGLGGPDRGWLVLRDVSRRYS